MGNVLSNLQSGTAAFLSLISKGRIAVHYWTACKWPAVKHNCTIRTHNFWQGWRFPQSGNETTGSRQSRQIHMCPWNNRLSLYIGYPAVICAPTGTNSAVGAPIGRRVPLLTPFRIRPTLEAECAMLPSSLRGEVGMSQCRMQFIWTIHDKWCFQRCSGIASHWTARGQNKVFAKIARYRKLTVAWDTEYHQKTAPGTRC